MKTKALIEAALSLSPPIKGETFKNWYDRLECEGVLNYADIDKILQLTGIDARGFTCDYVFTFIAPI